MIRAVDGQVIALWDPFAKRMYRAGQTRQDRRRSRVPSVATGVLRLAVLAADVFTIPADDGRQRKPSAVDVNDLASIPQGSTSINAAMSHDGQ